MAKGWIAWEANNLVQKKVDYEAKITSHDQLDKDQIPISMLRDNGTFKFFF